jgi:predicted AAA+ superfamily ATPase
MKRQTIHDTLLRRLKEPRRFLQVLTGPRQVGKTTVVRQVMAALKYPAHYAAADDPAAQGDLTWLRQQWDLARLLAGQHQAGALLVLDEIQKVPDWATLVKLLWDEDTRQKTPLRVVLSGSSPLLVHKGVTESLAGRFETVTASHWSFVEMKKAFGWNLERYIYYGAYPGAAGLINEPERWRRYVLDSLIETTVARDILMLTRVDKPALLRRLFQLGCAYSGQILSYQKMLGQLVDAGNTVTLAHYLDLLQGAGMLAGLPKYTGHQIRQRGSSPKLQALNTAIITVSDPRSLDEARRDGDYWGRLTESAIGAHLFNSTLGSDIKISYWRERDLEVDFVLRRGRISVAIEVKSGRRKAALPGMTAFAKLFNPKRQLLVGAQGIGLGEFLSTPADYWLQ